MKVPRRTFVKGAVVVGAVGTVAGGVSALQRDRHDEAAPAPHLEEEIIPNVCLGCPGGCGILVRVVDGKAVKVDGNPAYPSNRGKTCPKGQLGPQVIYDPDRLRGPMIRTGPRGSGQFRPISWEQALSEVAAKLAAVRAEAPHSLVMMMGRNRGQMGDLWDRFCAAFGTPNAIGHSSICEDGSAIAHEATQGWKSYAGYDWDRCSYLITFGGSFLEAWRPTAANLMRYGGMRRGRADRRFRMVVVDPRFSVTAAHADDWVPIKPCTDGALALGMAHVIVREGRVDRAFVEEHTFGFEDFTGPDGRRHMGFRTLLDRYTPERVEEITGVPASRVVRLARDFADSPPAIAAGSRGSSMQTNGVFNRMAIHALNGLCGGIDRPGGVLCQIGPPFTPWPAVVQDDAARRGVAMPRLDYAHTARYPAAGKVYQDVPDRILEGKPYPARALLVYYTNPMFSTPDVDRWRKAIEKLDLVVTFSPFMDETTAHADYVLPDCAYLERWQDDVIYPSLGYPVWGLRRPAVKPLHDNRNSADVLLALAHRVGGTTAESFPWKDMQEILRFRARGVFESQRGSFRASEFEAWWREFLRLGVWTDVGYPFASQDAEQWPRVLSTPSGKFEFYSQKLEAHLRHAAEARVEARVGKPSAKPDAAELARRRAAEEEAVGEVLGELGIVARGDEAVLPHFEPPRFVGDAGQFPLHLVTYKTVTHGEGRTANTPMAQESFNVQTGEAWTTHCQVNPETARALGLREDGEAVLESPLGALRVRVRFMPHHPSVVVMPFGLGHEVYGRFARNRGVNPNHILANENDRLGGLCAFTATRVRIRPA